MWKNRQPQKVLSKRNRISKIFSTTYIYYKVFRLISFEDIKLQSQELFCVSCVCKKTKSTTNWFSKKISLNLDNFYYTNIYFFGNPMPYTLKPPSFVFELVILLENPLSKYKRLPKTRPKHTQKSQSWAICEKNLDFFEKQISRNLQDFYYMNIYCFGNSKT